MITPCLRKLGKRLSEKEKAYVRKIESNLISMAVPLAKSLASKPIGLTSTELEVAALVKDGNNSKEFARVLGISRRTVDFHRLNIPEKLGLENAKTSLRTWLVSLR
jgi:DNA-binding CsgD family transcriptional regulator